MQVERRGERASGGSVTATVVLTLLGRKVQLQIEVPTGPTRPLELMPLFQSLTDTFVQIGVKKAEAEGASISCKKGCGACCSQLVPISQVEVESLKRLVAGLPERRRTEIVERFEHALRQLDAAGLLGPLRAPETVPKEEIQQLGIAYFAQAIPCPFLEQGSCSIHEARPLACREYLVTSPAINCASPTAETVRMVQLPAKMSRAVRHLDGTAHSSWIPMILALEPCSELTEGAVKPGTAVVASLFESITGKAIPYYERRQRFEP
ncbi:MAG: YkgJ family cysteine cluster protein [Pseudomonadota bacterium]|nr:YkgJ family cysteine cluster protein [Pseudomonadota bacterium]